MEIELLLKVAGVGLVASVVCQVLKSTGREEYAPLVSLSGLLISLILLAERIGSLISLLRETFGV